MEDQTEAVAVVITGLQGLGYVVPFGAVHVRGDGVVVFNLAEQDPKFDSDLKALGFAGPYDVNLQPNRHHIHPSAH